jgi:methionyl-tRNA synthetase
MILRYRDGAIPAVDTDPELAAEFDGLRDEVTELFDRFELTQALEVIWRRVRRLNRYVEERAPWQLAKDKAQSGALDQTLASLAEGIRAVSVLLHPYMPQTTAKLLGAVGSDPLALSDGNFAARSQGGQVEAIEALFPKQA